MKKNVVRGLALALVILMCLSLLPLAARADEGDFPAAAGTYEPVRIEPTCGENGYIQMYNAATGAWGEVVDFIPATGAHSFMPVVNEDYLIEQGESFCLDGDLYWMSCANRTADGRVCGASAEDAYNAAVDRLVAELTERKNQGEQKSDAEWQLIAENAIKEFDARYKFTYGGQGHAWVEMDGQEATCTSDGWTAYAECENCGEIVDYSVIPAKGHRWGEYAVVTEATETEPGLEARVCEVCGVEETREIPVLTPAEPEPTAAPTPTPEVKAETKTDAKTEDKAEDKTETKTEATPAPTAEPAPTTTPAPTAEPEDEEPDWEEIMKLRENVQLAQGAVDPGVVDAFVEAMPTLGLDAETTAILDVKDVTPVRKDDFTPLSDEEVAKLGGLDFVMPLPEDYDPEGGPLEVYHFNEKTQEWELMEVEVDLENGVVVVKNAGSFSPFAMIRKAGAADPFARNGKRLDDYVVTQGVPKKAAGRVITPLGATPGITVTYDGNGGKTDDEKETVTQPVSDSDKVFHANTFIRTGYEFAGWDTDSEGHGTRYAVGAEIPFTSNKTVYAVWNKVITVEYQGNGATGGDTPSAEVVAGSTYTIANNGFTKDPATFDSWNTKYDGSGVKYEKDQTIPFKNSDNDLKLYAQWRVPFYFDANDGYAPSGPLTIEPVLEHTKVDLPKNTYTCTNHVFAGWNTKADGSGDAYDDEGTIPANKVIGPGPITLYAQWEKEYTITFNGNGGKTSDEKLETTQKITESEFGTDGVALDANPFTKTNDSGDKLVFTGWKRISDNKEFEKDAKVKAGDFTDQKLALTAQWADPIKVTFNAGDGSGGPYTASMPKDQEKEIPSVSEMGISYPNFFFKEWYNKEKDYHWKDKEAITATQDYDKLTMTAQWIGPLEISGTVSAKTSEGYVGETLSTNAPEGAKHEWYSGAIKVSEDDKYTVPKERIGSTITCKVTYNDQETTCKNKKTITDIAWVQDIIDKDEKGNSLTDYAQVGQIKGVANGMFYRTDKKTNWTPINNAKDGVWTVPEDGTYYFKASETSTEESDGVKVYAWYTFAARSISSTGTVGTSGLTFKLDDSAMPTSSYPDNRMPTTIANTTRDNDVLRYKLASGTQVYVVRKGTSHTVTLTVTPPSSQYAHVYRNGNLIKSFGNSAATTSTTRTTYSSTYSARTGSYSPATTSTYSSSTTGATWTTTVPSTEPSYYTVYYSYSSSSPRTADESQLGLWSALCVVSLAAGVTLLTVQRKRKHKA